MNRRRQRVRRGAPGAPPGALVPRAEAEPSRVVVRAFGTEAFEEVALDDVDALASFRESSGCVWVEITGLADTEMIAAIGRAFGLHELALEDVLDLGQRAKVETYDDHVFVVLRTLEMAARVEAHQLCMFFGDRFVVTFQDVDRGAFEPVRARLRHGRGRIRSRGADYLAYALIDTVIDHYYPVIEEHDDHLERVEDKILEAHDVDAIGLARRARQDLQTVRHALWPAREVVATMLREEAPRVTDETRMHLRDCHDHVMQLQEMVESSREIAASLLEAYISSVSLKTNDVMKVLTVIATIFIPLTFITGVYGMNFRPESSPLNMPELDWYWGYPFALLLMLVTAAGFVYFFRKRRWFGSDGRRRPSDRDE